MTRQRGGLPPGPALPALGQTLLFWWKVDRFLRVCRCKYGSTFTIRVFPWSTVVVISEPEAIRGVFTGDPEIWRAGKSYELLAPLIGAHSLVVLDGEDHLRVRKRLLPPFHGDLVNRYEQLITDITVKEVARWPIGQPIELIDRMQAITLEVMLSAVIGAGDSERRHELRTALARAVKLRPVILLMWAWEPLRAIGPWRAFNRRLELARALLRREIEQRRADPAVGVHSDILSSLIYAGELDDEELLDQLATLLLAGHDTSTTDLAWSVERLLRHPMALALARESDRYLDAVVKETLRLRPVLPAVTRQTACDVEIGGYVAAGAPNTELASGRTTAVGRPGP